VLEFPLRATPRDGVRSGRRMADSVRFRSRNFSSRDKTSRGIESDNRSRSHLESLPGTFRKSSSATFEQLFETTCSPYLDVLPPNTSTIIPRIRRSGSLLMTRYRHAYLSIIRKGRKCRFELIMEKRKFSHGENSTSPVRCE